MINYKLFNLYWPNVNLKKIIMAVTENGFSPLTLRIERVK